MVQGNYDSPVSANLSGQSQAGGAANSQEKGYELFSASLSRAMKAYALYSDTQVHSSRIALRTAQSGVP